MRFGTIIIHGCLLSPANMQSDKSNKQKVEKKEIVAQ